MEIGLSQLVQIELYSPVANTQARLCFFHACLGDSKSLDLLVKIDAIDKREQAQGQA